MSIKRVFNGSGASSDIEEHVEDEPEEGANEEAMDNGANGTLKRKRNWYKLHQKQAAYVMLLERTSAGVLSRGVSEEVSVLTKIPVTKVLPAVTQSVSQDYMINFLLPAIRQRWPAAERGTTIYIQQDNAKTHIPVDDPEFVAAVQADGWDIRLTCQPPNSPDLNILDLGFFAALQSNFHKLSPGSVDDIVQKVQQAFDEYPAERSNRIFLTLQACMREVLEQLGGNRYKVPHMRKEVLQRLKTLPVTLQCIANFVKWAIDSLQDA
ncbi:hypothetical protein ACQ4PT_049991 [Festuca glaucescens]